MISGFAKEYDEAEQSTWTQLKKADRVSCGDLTTGYWPKRLCILYPTVVNGLVVKIGLIVAACTTLYPTLHVVGAHFNTRTPRFLMNVC